MTLTDADRAAIARVVNFHVSPDGEASIDATPSMARAIFAAGKAAGMALQREADAKIADEGEPGSGQDTGYRILCGCGRRIREAAK